MYDSNYGITSDLVNSYAWDTAIVFIQKYSGDTAYSKQVNKFGDYGNTGEMGDEKCHIHDMSQNVCEWTTETGYSSSYCCVYRAGSRLYG